MSIFLVFYKFFSLLDYVVVKDNIKCILPCCPAQLYRCHVLLRILFEQINWLIDWLNLPFY